MEPAIDLVDDDFGATHFRVSNIAVAHDQDFEAHEEADSFFPNVDIIA